MNSTHTGNRTDGFLTQQEMQEYIDLLKEPDTAEVPFLFQRRSALHVAHAIEVLMSLETAVSYDEEQDDDPLIRYSGWKTNQAIGETIRVLCKVFVDRSPEEPNLKV